MTARVTPRILIFAFVGGLMAAHPGRAAAQDAEVVLEWNRILQATIGTAGALPPTVFFTRPYAMMHVAIFDALNSIDPIYTPYAIQVDRGTNASREAAAAQAAHDVLAELFPNQRAIFAASLAGTLSRLPAAAAQEGSRVGAAAARAILDLRANDGWNRQPTPYLLPDLPGFYQVTPPQNAVVTFTHYQDVLPFAVAGRSQFLMEPPPLLTSERYATDFNEVKRVGGTTSTARTDEQTNIARRWASIGASTSSLGVWNNLLRDVARRSGLNGIDTARVYALLNMAVHDGLLTTFSAKFLYGLWRPVTAIRAADRDGNAATEPDPTWNTLIPTPPYPSHPGNMACIAATSARLMTRAFGRDDIAFSVTWTGVNAPDITRSFNGFRQLADEEADSRIYGGIHFRFETLASFGVCTPLADYVYENYLRRRQ